MPISARLVFASEDDYDRQQASNGSSRYGAYLAHAAMSFKDFDEHPTTSKTEFAATAWTLALPPVMSPGYIQAHPRVRDVRARHDDDRRLAIEVDVVSAFPTKLQQALGYRWRGWHRDLSQRWHEPSDYSRLTALPLLTLHVPIDADLLPTPVYHAGGVPDTGVAKAALRVLCEQLNDALNPVMTALEPTTRRIDHD